MKEKIRDAEDQFQKFQHVTYSTYSRGNTKYANEEIIKKKYVRLFSKAKE